MSAGARSTAAAAAVGAAAGLWLAAVLPGRAAPLRAPAAPVIEVVGFTPAEVELGGQRSVTVRGMLVNRGPGPARAIHVSLTARRTPGGEIVGTGGGVSWLDALDEGESGPFSVGVRFCCLPDIGAYDLTTSAAAAPAPRYRDLAVDGLHEQTVDGEGRIYGHLRNTGAAYLNASATDVYAGFWQGEDLVELQTARLPVFYTPDAPTGQSHPPGVAYPWAIAFPDVPFDRYQVWTFAAPFPTGVFPVPLAAEAVTAHRDVEGIVVRGELRSCGAVAVALVVIVVEARDGDGRLLEFGRAVLSLDDALDPGERQRFAVTWPGVRTAVDPSRVTAAAYAIDTQTVRPPAVPCPAAWPLGYLPWASQAGHGPGAAAPPPPEGRPFPSIPSALNARN